MKATRASCLHGEVHEKMEARVHAPFIEWRANSAMRHGRRNEYVAKRALGLQLAGEDAVAPTKRLCRRSDLAQTSNFGRV